MGICSSKPGFFFFTGLDTKKVYQYKGVDHGGTLIVIEVGIVYTTVTEVGSQIRFTLDSKPFMYRSENDRIRVTKYNAPSTFFGLKKWPVVKGTIRHSGCRNRYEILGRTDEGLVEARLTSRVYRVNRTSHVTQVIVFEPVGHPGAPNPGESEILKVKRVTAKFDGPKRLSKRLRRSVKGLLKGTREKCAWIRESTDGDTICF